MRVTLCGVRGSTPAPGRDFERYGGHTSCLALTLDDADAPSLLLDAGTGLRAASALMSGAPYRGAILLSHLHWDHIQGLPFFAAGDREDSEVHLALPAQAEPDGAAALLARAMSPPFFPVSPEQLRGSWRFGMLEPGVSTHGGFEVLAREIPHKGGRTFGYRVSDGRSALTYMPDHWPTSLGPGPDGLGDYHEAAVELARGSDLLVHDAQLLPAELPAEAMLGHSCGAYARELARRAGAAAVLLFHHRPDRSDRELDELQAGFSGGEPPVTVARQGATLQL